MSIEKFVGKESSDKKPKVILHFMRHSIKEKAPEKNDTEIQLNEAGRKLASTKFDAPVDFRFAHTVGSPRVRTHETATIAATGDPEATPTDLGLGKMRVNPDLDFGLDVQNPYGKKFYDEFMAGKAMPFLVHESDALAKLEGDQVSSTYSRMAANIAKIVYKNYEVALRASSILDKSENPENEQNDFERVLATHGTIQESFLLKVIEKMKGESARDELLEIVGLNGFDFIEGFDVTLAPEGDAIQIRLTYKKDTYILDEIVPPEIVKQIVDEGAV